MAIKFLVFTVLKTSLLVGAFPEMAGHIGEPALHSFGIILFELKNNFTTHAFLLSTVVL